MKNLKIDLSMFPKWDAFGVLFSDHKMTLAWIILLLACVPFLRHLPLLVGTTDGEVTNTEVRSHNVG